MSRYDAISRGRSVQRDVLVTLTLAAAVALDAVLTW
jgi:hypothetical protein